MRRTNWIRFALTGAALATLPLTLAGCDGADGPADPEQPQGAISVVLGATSFTLAQGQNGTVAITIARSGGFTGAVDLALEGAPAGVSGSFSPAQVPGTSTSSTLTLTATESAAPGAHTLTVRASGAGVAAQTAALSLTLEAAPPAGAYTLTVQPDTLEVPRGGSAGATVRIARTGFSGAVALSIAGAPAGVTASVSPASLTGDSAAIAIGVGAGVAPGTHTLAVTGRAEGLQDRSASLTLTVAEAGGFELSLAPAALTVERGASATATVHIARTGGFAGAVALAASGAPAGVTATFEPASASGDSASLTLSASAAAPTGSFTLTVTGTAAGQPERTAMLGVEVTTPPPGGDLIWSFCPSSAPVWIAYQNDQGPWTQIQASPGGSVTIPIESRGGVAWVQSPASGFFMLNVVYGLVDELRMQGEDWCGLHGGGKAVSGSVAGLGAEDGATVLFGNSGTFLTGGPQTFTMQNLPDGQRDLLAARQPNASGPQIPDADRFIFRRGIEPAAGSTMPALDFASGEAFAPVTYTATIGNLGAEAAVLWAGYFTANGTQGMLSLPEARTSPTRSYPAVPADRQIAGDLHQLFAGTDNEDPLGGTARMVISFFRQASDRTITLGPQLATPSASRVASAPYLRVGVQVPGQNEYDALMMLLVTQPARSAAVQASAAYYGGRPGTWSLEIPDLTAAGFQPTWGPQAGALFSIWAATGVGVTSPAPFTAGPVDGTVLLSAMAAGLVP